MMDTAAVAALLKLLKIGKPLPSRVHIPDDTIFMAGSQWEVDAE
jgi:hypothetical protein